MRTACSCAGPDTSSVAALARAGGIESLLIGSDAVEPGGEAPFTITGSRGESVPVAGRLFSVPWEDDKAFALITTPVPPPGSAADTPPDESTALADAHGEIAELRTILDTTSDGVVVLDRDLQHRVGEPQRAGAVRLGPAGRCVLHRPVRACSVNVVLDHIVKAADGTQTRGDRGDRTRGRAASLCR